MSDSIVARPSNLLTAMGVHTLIPEFTDKSYTLEYFASRIRGKRHLILVAYHDEEEAGYLVAYDRFNDGSFYCWMVGVTPDFREKGILKALMDYLFEWAKEKGYQKIKIKTRNHRREMLAYLVKYGFYVIEVESRLQVEENQILFEKAL